MLKLSRHLVNHHPHLFEIIRFIIIGCLATAIDYVVMSVVLYCLNPTLYPHFNDIWFGKQNPSTINTIISTGIGFSVGLIFNYIFSVLFVFHKKGKSRSTKGFLLFALLSLGGLMIHLGGMYLGYGILGINEWIVKTFLSLFVLFYNYTTRKFFIFKPQIKQVTTSQITPQNQPEI